MAVLPIGMSGEEAAGYQIEQSLRFNSADSAYLLRTPSASNTQIMTWSLWIKKTSIGVANKYLFACNDEYIRFNDTITDTLRVKVAGSNLITNQLFRDPSAWGMLTIAVDTTQTTASNRVKVYWNGARITSFSTETYPSLSANATFNTTEPHRIGSYAPTVEGFYDGYMADIHFIDGQQLDPTNFGEFNSDTGVWQPIEYTGTYGTNGFHLNFVENDVLYSTTSGGKFSTQSATGIRRDLGEDSSAYFSGMTISGDFDFYWTYGTGSGSLTPGDAYIVGVIATSYQASFNYNNAYLGGASSTMFYTLYGSGGFKAAAYVSGTNTDAITAYSNPQTTTYVRMVRSGSTVSVYQGSPGSWTLQKTFTGTFSGDLYFFVGSGDKNENISLNNITFANINGGTRTLTDSLSIAGDASGNGNGWGTFNIQTSGSSNDQMVDVPTLWGTDDGNGGEVRGNYSTVNAIYKDSDSVLTNGNLSVRTGDSSTSFGSNHGTIAVSSGKWYYEFTQTNIYSTDPPNRAVGWSLTTHLNTQYPGQTGSWTYVYNGTKYVNGTSTSYGATWGTGNVIGAALDLDAGTLTFYKDGVSQGVAATGLTGTFIPCFGRIGNDAGRWIEYNVNFGQLPFAHAAPTGFKALCTTNLPDPAITDGKDHFKTYLYTGNGGGLQVGEYPFDLSPYDLEKSLRFNSADSTYLSRTFGAGNRKTWTLSCWLKKSVVVNDGNDVPIFSAVGATAYYDSIRFNSDSTFRIYYSGGAYATAISGSPAYRAPSAWYHFVVTQDTTQATESLRLRVWINGVQQTLTGIPALNYESGFNNNVQHEIGKQYSQSQYFNGYMAEVNFIDGSALAPSDFGQYDGNNYWVPKAYTGSYTGNSFYLDFNDDSSTSALGTDGSGLGNNWSTNGFSVTTDTDSVTDVPTRHATDTSVGNYATLNPLDYYTSTPTNGNLYYTTASASYAKCRSTIWFDVASSDGWYAEFTLPASGTIDNLGVGVADNSVFANNYYNAGAYGIATRGAGGSFTWYKTNPSGYDGSTSVSQANGQVVGIAVKNGNVYFSINGSWILSGDPTTESNPTFSGLTGKYTFFVYTYQSNSLSSNFGQQPFAYTPPTGFLPLNSTNLVEDTTDLETPDLVWIKNRTDTSTSHYLFDSVRGVGKYLLTDPDTNPVEATDVNSLIQFNRNGFLLGSAAGVNTADKNYVGWGWKVGGATPVSNTDGTNTSAMVSANPDAGISIVTYTGTGTNSTVGHGLSPSGYSNTPAFIVTKRISGAAGNMFAYHKDAQASGAYVGYLNLTTAFAASTAIWNNTQPTDTVFSLGTGNSNVSTAPYVAYCFAPVEGYSAFGSYTGNGSATGDGPFVYTGFRPRWILIKGTTSLSTDNWTIWDTETNTYNVANNSLSPSLNAAQNTSRVIDILSNGFKPRENDSRQNTSGETYIYAAFGDSFKYSLAR